MKVFICPRSNEIGKFCGVVDAFSEIWNGTVLDVGCRSSTLKQVLSKHNSKLIYFGVDLHPHADVIANAENLPFHEQAFDVAVALDVLEHTNDIHKAFSELCKEQLVGLLSKHYPICMKYKDRIKFLLGYKLSGKFGIPDHPPQDRHRWFFSLNEARVFAQDMAQRCGFRIVEEGCLIGPRRGFVLRRAMVGLFPNLLSPWYVVMLSRE